MTTPEQKLKLKLLVDKKRNKVIFAEAGSEFVDVLFGFLTLPLGTIIRQLNKHCDGQRETLGCLSKLYASVSSFDTSSFCKSEAKSMFLNPENASDIECRKLKLKIDDSKPVEYSRCQRSYCKHTEIMYTNNPYQCTCACGSSRYIQTLPSSSSNGVFVSAGKSFIITDDLGVLPSEDGWNLELLKDFVTDDDIPEQKTITVGLKEIMHMFKWSFVSRTLLTDLLNWQLNADNIKPDNIEGTVSSKHELADKTDDTKKIIVKALLQKSTNKFMFLVARVDFIEFLFRLLTIPLGSTVSLLGGKSGLWSIDRLHKSISKLSSDYLSLSKLLLTNPKVACRNISNSTIKFLSFNEQPGLLLMDLVGEKELIKNASTFMVTDDLEVTLLSSSASIISHIFAKNIPISDVEERDLHIGTAEALEILRASLTSSSAALSNALLPSTASSASAVSGICNDLQKCMKS